MKNLYTPVILALMALCMLSGCGDRTKPGETPAEASRTELPNPSESGFATSDENATSLVKIGMVIVEKTPKKLKGKEGKKDFIYRFHTFDNDRRRLRLTTADNNEGKSFAEEKEIDLKPWANQMIEVQGSSFTNRWVFNAKINGIVVPDTLHEGEDTTGFEVRQSQ